MPTNTSAIEDNCVYCDDEIELSLPFHLLGLQLCHDEWDPPTIPGKS